MGKTETFEPVIDRHWADDGAQNFSILLRRCLALKLTTELSWQNTEDIQLEKVAADRQGQTNKSTVVTVWPHLAKIRNFGKIFGGLIRIWSSF